MLRWLLTLTSLTLVYTLTLASFQPWDLALGALLSSMLLLGARSFITDNRPAPRLAVVRRALFFWPFALAVLRDVLEGTWNVSLVVLRIRRLNRPGIVRIPIEDHTPSGVAVLSLVRTLSPGSFLVDVDWEQRVMLFHIIDASDPDAIRTSYHNFYYRYQYPVFP